MEIFDLNIFANGKFLSLSLYFSVFIVQQTRKIIFNFIFKVFLIFAISFFCYHLRIFCQRFVVEQVCSVFIFVLKNFGMLGNLYVCGKLSNTTLNIILGNIGNRKPGLLTDDNLYNS